MTERITSNDATFYLTQPEIFKQIIALTDWETPLFWLDNMHNIYQNVPKIVEQNLTFLPNSPSLKYFEHIFDITRTKRRIIKFDAEIILEKTQEKIICSHGQITFFNSPHYHILWQSVKSEPLYIS